MDGSVSRDENLRLALRVLSAFNSWHLPEPEDVAQLCALTESQEERNLDIDELACLVIQRASRPASARIMIRQRAA
jgi:hypothetical protein